MKNSEKYIHHPITGEVTDKTIRGNTPLFHMRLPLYLRETIDRLRGKRTVTGWIIEAIQDKARKESNNPPEL